MLGIASLPGHGAHLSEYVSHSSVQIQVLKFMNIFSLGIYWNQTLYLRFVIVHDQFSEVH